VHRKFHRLTNSLGCSLTTLALLGALVLGAGPAIGQAIRTPSSKIIETDVDTRLDRGLQQTRRDMNEFVVGNMLFVLLHEMAHVHVTEMGLPVLGREEDAADAFATLSLLKMGSEFSHGVLVQAAKGWFLNAERDERQGNRLAFYDEHGLDRQRAYQIICLMVGSDPEKFGELADLVKMPEERQETCQGDYSNATYSWDLVLKAHRRTADQPKIVITTVYGEDKSGRDLNARSFRALRLLESVADRAAEEFIWRKPFSLELQSCGKPGAQWDLMSHRLIVCYEMAEEFVQLHGDLAAERKSAAPQAADELIARNIKTPPMQRIGSKAGPAEDPKPAPVSPTEAGVKIAPVAQIERIADAMAAETIEFVAFPDWQARTTLRQARE
jgi:Putative metallopeptidase